MDPTMILPAGVADEAVRRAEVKRQAAIDQELRKVFAEAVARGAQQASGR